MKAGRLAPVRACRPRVVMRDRVTEVTDLVGDFDTAFFARGGPATLAGDLRRHRPLPLHDAASVERWAAPIARPGKVVCIGLNYAVHAAEARMDLPAEPVVFMKAPSTVVGPDDDVLIPVGGTKTDWEVELGVVIGSTARYLDSAEQARDVIAGYCVSHDVSERHFQLERGGQWVKGKSCETFNPLGPWLVTADEVADPQPLSLHLTVNGELRQQGTTGSMIFPVLDLVHYLSQFMVLEPGDLVNTGTPPGVGMGMVPPQYLREGDVVELDVEGLGQQRQVVRQATRD